MAQSAISVTVKNAGADDKPLWDRARDASARCRPPTSSERWLTPRRCSTVSCPTPTRLRDDPMLSPKLRELAILTVGHMHRLASTRSRTTSRMALKAGISAGAAGRGAATSKPQTLFDEAERAVMALARESTLRVDVTDATWAAAAAASGRPADGRADA